MSLTPDEITAIHEAAERTAVAQGHTPKITDPSAIAQIVAIVNPSGRTGAKAS